MHLPWNKEQVEYRDESATEGLLPPEAKEECGDRGFLQSSKARSARPFFFNAAVLLCAVSVGLVIGYWCHGQEPTLSDYGIDLSPFPPEIFERHDKPFVPDPGFVGPSDEAKQNWEDLNSGWVSIYLPHPEDYGLHDPGLQAPFFLFDTAPQEALPLSKQFYALNNLHILHCTHNIRKQFNRAMYEPDKFNLLDDGMQLIHIEHCFEYIRLSMMCADYMAFETDAPPGSPPEYTRGGVGWGVVHRCIDWEKLMEFQRSQVALYNSTWQKT